MSLDEAVRASVEAAVGYTFRDPALIARALTHASLANHPTESNERLELLGDSVLGFVVCEHLFERYLEADEGELTKIKSFLVSRRKCADFAVEAGLVKFMALGKGLSSGAIPGSIAAAAFEAIIAAIYLDGGMEHARTFVMRYVEPHVDSTERMGHQMNFKSVLQQVTQSTELGAPTYLVVDQRGPDHEKSFEICVVVGKKRFASSWAGNKKNAEQAAALLALRELGHAIGDEPNVQITWGRTAPAASSTSQPLTTDTIARATHCGVADPSTTASASDV